MVACRVNVCVCMYSAGVPTRRVRAGTGATMIRISRVFTCIIPNTDTFLKKFILRIHILVYNLVKKCTSFGRVLLSPKDHNLVAKVEIYAISRFLRGGTKSYSSILTSAGVVLRTQVRNAAGDRVERLRCTLRARSQLIFFVVSVEWSFDRYSSDPSRTPPNSSGISRGPPNNISCRWPLQGVDVSPSRMYKY